MRELKFRVWDNQNNNWLINQRIEDYPVELLYSDHKFYIAHSLDNLDNYIIQQYTGLKDKNGVDIYEGDILIFRPSYDESLGGRFGNAVFSASFKDGSFRFGDEFADQDGANYYEIIGNIFENNELLEA